VQVGAAAASLPVLYFASQQDLDLKVVVDASRETSIALKYWIILQIRDSRRYGTSNHPGRVMEGEKDSIAVFSYPNMLWTRSKTQVVFCEASHIVLILLGSPLLVRGDSTPSTGEYLKVDLHEALHRKNFSRRGLPWCAR
jgi:hypothetical protein